jgi:transcriptional regulator with GAF, ATPase, and Fis domain
MVRVNCAALPATLLESELFGREKGAYTGALSRQIGRFELANTSTIFLDEIGELSLEAQAKLLRVLQEKQVERLGNPVPVPLDVRVIAATNRELEAEVRAGRFRQDLYFRLNVFPVAVPPLRARVEDIPALVWAFVHELSPTIGKRIDGIAQADMDALKNYSWPGNVRELRNVVERSMIMATGTKMRIVVPVDPAAARLPGRGPEDTERTRIVDVLTNCGWRIRGAGGAAEVLGLKPTTLETRMQKLGIRRPSKSK